MTDFKSLNIYVLCPINVIGAVAYNIKRYSVKLVDVLDLINT